MRIRLALILIAVCAMAADPLNRDSPQSSVIAFLQACHAKDLPRAARYLDLRKLQANDRSKEGTRLAQQLGQILENDARFDEAELSRDPDGDLLQPVASFQLNGKTFQLQMERVELRPGVSVWLFSSESVAAIPQLARIASDSPIEKYLPAPLVNWKIMDTALWRWIALLLLVAVLTLISRGVCRGAVYCASPALKRVLPGLDPAQLDRFLGPLRLLLVALGFRAGIEWIGPSAWLRRYLEHTAAFLFFAALAWFCMKLVDMTIVRLNATLHDRRQTFAYSVLPLASRVAKVLLGVLAVLAVLGNLGYNTTTILAGLGVGGLAFALAAQKTIENLFGGVAVITDRPVTVGDVCKFDDTVGTVEDIGLRSTRIRTPDRTLLTIPNAAFSGMTLENLSLKDKTWFHVILNLRRDTTPHQVRELLNSITALLKANAKVETGSYPVRFQGVGTYSLDLEIDAYISSINDDELLPLQQELYLKILDAVQAAGTALALPVQEYFSANEPPAGNDRSSPNDKPGTPVAPEKA